MNASSIHDTEILIIGAGPTGLVACTVADAAGRAREDYVFVS
jgi:predicted flavoprotein YhiN